MLTITRRIGETLRLEYSDGQSVTVTVLERAVDVFRLGVDTAQDDGQLEIDSNTELDKGFFSLPGG